MQQFKIVLTFALAKLPQQNSFEIIRRVIGFLAGIDCIQNVPEDLFGQVGMGVGIFKLLRSDPNHGGFCLDVAEPDRWFLLIVRIQFHLGRCDCRGEFMTDLWSHGGRELVDGCCPGGGRRVVPRRWEK
jgi:hypothetical protein